MKVLPKTKLGLAWDGLGDLIKLILFFVITLAIIIVSSNFILFKRQYTQTENFALTQAENEITLNSTLLSSKADFMKYNMEILRERILHKLGTKDFEDVALALFEDHITKLKLPKQLAFYSAADGSVLALAREDFTKIDRFDDEILVNIRATPKNEDVVYYDSSEALMHGGYPVYDSDNVFVGAVIITGGDFAQAFGEQMYAGGAENIYRAFIDASGNYMWKFPDYTERYGNETNIMQDIKAFPISDLPGSTKSFIYGDSIVSFAPIQTPENIYAVIVQVEKHNLYVETINSLRGTLWGINLGFAGILGVLFIYVAQLIGVEIRFRKREMKETLEAIHKE